MPKPDAGILAGLIAGLRDQNSSITSLLQTCLLLGADVDSERLRDWAQRELKGYERDTDAPEYRRFDAMLCIDRVIPEGNITGQSVSPSLLPKFTQGHFTETVVLTHGVGRLEALLKSADDRGVKVVPPGAAEFIVPWNNERPINDKVTAMYWMVRRSSLTGVLIGIRTALVEFVAALDSRRAENAAE